MNVYNATTMDPIFPISDAYIEEFILNSYLEKGLHFDNQTGIISGTPLFDYKSRSTTIFITARNALGNVTTSFTFYFQHSFSPLKGIRSCILPLAAPLPLLPELFTSSLPRSCSIESTLSFTSATDSKSELLGDAAYAMLQFSGHFKVHYLAPVSFAFSTRSKTLVLLDGYETPLFETDETSSFVTHRVTIKLAATYHRITVYVTAGAESAYFAMFYSYHILNQPDLLITSEVMSYSVPPPRFLEIHPTVGFAHQPFDLYLQSESPILNLQMIDSTQQFVIAGLTHLTIRDPSPDEGSGLLYLYSSGGLSTLSVPYRIETPRQGMMVSVLENGVRQQKLIESREEFTAECFFDRV